MSGRFLHALYSFVSVVVSVLDWLLEEASWLLCFWLEELAELAELSWLCSWLEELACFSSLWLWLCWSSWLGLFSSGLAESSCSCLDDEEDDDKELEELEELDEREMLVALEARAPKPPATDPTTARPKMT